MGSLFVELFAPLFDGADCWTDGEEPGSVAPPVERVADGYIDD